MAQKRVALLKGSLLLDVTGGEDRTPPTEFRLFGRGINRSEKGDFLFDDIAAQSCMDWQGEKAVDLPIDYEHEMVTDVPGKKLAAGWFTPEIRDGELWATNVRWTPDAEKHLRSAEYRYFSPAFEYDPSTGRVLKLYNFALTNRPALNGIPALVAASATVNPNNEGLSMEEELKKLAAKVEELSAALAAKDAECASLKAKLSSFEKDKEDEAMSAAVGLSASAPKVELRAAITQLATLRSKVLEATGKGSVSEALGVIEAWKSDAAAAVQLRADSAAREQAALKSEVDGLIATAVKDMRLPAAEDHPRRKFINEKCLSGGLTKESVATLSAYLGTLSPLGKTEATQLSATGVVTLSADAAAMAKRHGNDPAAVAKFVAERRAQQSGHVIG